MHAFVSKRISVSSNFLYEFFLKIETQEEMNQESTDAKTLNEDNVQLKEDCTKEQVKSEEQQLNEKEHVEDIEDDFEINEKKAGTIE